MVTHIAALIDWTMAIPLPVLISPFTDLSMRPSSSSSSLLAKSGNQESPKPSTTTLAGVLSVLEFVASTPKTVPFEHIGAGWVPGCPFPDPLIGILSDADEEQVVNCNCYGKNGFKCAIKQQNPLVRKKLTPCPY